MNQPTPTERLKKIIHNESTKEEIAAANFEEGYRQGEIEAHQKFYVFVESLELLVAGFKQRLKDNE